LLLLMLAIIGIPLLLAAGALAGKRPGVYGLLNSLGYLVVLVASSLLLAETFFSGSALRLEGFFYVDLLSAFFILVAAVITLATSLYSIGYIKRDIARTVISERKAKYYYVFFNLFCLSMFFVPMVNNLGLLWVAIEITTLVSAFLVGFYNTKKSVEAAWKYIIICSVGIIFALLGTILFSYAISLSGGMKSLNWTDAITLAAKLNKNIVKVAFIFILVGYGTKAGLAPMHTWLPDAHSQAVAPVSALLSGVLLKMAIYAILRFGLLVIKAVEFAYFGNLMILLGLISLVVSCGLILVQKDLKRLLAYSSIEHIGIIAIGLGLGTPLAILGALLQVFNHAVTKSLMFFGAGNIVSTYDKHNIHSLRGVLKVLPFSGVMVLLGVFALTGLPPFSIFVSELMIILAAFSKQEYLVVAALLFLLAVIFGGFIYRFSEMLFGKQPKDLGVATEPLSGKLAFLFLFILMLAVGPLFMIYYKDWLWIVKSLFQV
jgi:hydrogenase-4 component F